MVTPVVFDIGETLIDESRMWQQVADDAGVPGFTLMAVIGGLIARGEPHDRIWDVLETAPVPGEFSAADFYPDALPCLRRLADPGYLVGAFGNTPASTEELLRPHTSFVGSSARWGVKKPAGAFFDRLIAECGRPAAEIAYVGDRVDNDIAPALAAGMLGVHIRRGPWGHLQDRPAAAVSIRSLSEIPTAFPS